MEVLRYVKASLDDAGVLDQLPMSTCENEAAWKAWNAGEGGRGTTGGWEERVRVVVEGCGSEGALFGAVRGDEPVGVGARWRGGGADLWGGQIRFVDLDEGVVEAVVEEIKRAVEEREGC